MCSLSHQEPSPTQWSLACRKRFYPTYQVVRRSSHSCSASQTRTQSSSKYPSSTLLTPKGKLFTTWSTTRLSRRTQPSIRAWKKRRAVRGFYRLRWHKKNLSPSHRRKKSTRQRLRWKLAILRCHAYMSPLDSLLLLSNKLCSTRSQNKTKTNQRTLIRETTKRTSLYFLCRSKSVASNSRKTNARTQKSHSAFRRLSLKLSLPSTRRS